MVVDDDRGEPVLPVITDRVMPEEIRPRITQPRMRLNPALLMVVAFAIAACSNLDAPGDLVPVYGLSAAEQTAMNRPSFESRERLIIEDAASWAAVWPRLASTPDTPIPSINFTSRRVIVASMGTQKSDGYRISVYGARELNDTLWVEVFQQSPGKGCVVVQVETSPVVLGVLARRAKAVVFLERAEPVAC